MFYTQAERYGSGWVLGGSTGIFEQDWVAHRNKFSFDTGLLSLVVDEGDGAY
jgi:hypothetical protein